MLQPAAHWLRKRVEGLFEGGVLEEVGWEGEMVCEGCCGRGCCAEGGGLYCCGLEWVSGRVAGRLR